MSWRRLWSWLKRANVLMLILLAFLVGLWAGLPASEEHDHSSASPSASGHDQDTVWTCSMHPQIQLPEPGQCPICGMDLIEVQPVKDEGDKSHRRVSLSKSAAALAKIRTTRVGRGEVSKELRLLGRLEYDETRVRAVTSWIGGRIDQLYVSNLGAPIGKGQVIGKMYSPEVYAAHQDLIQARKQLDRLGDALPVAKNAAQAALEAARQRLGLLGLPEKEITAMEKEEQPRKHVALRASTGGTVIEQKVHEGAYVATGTPLYRVAGLAKLWVQLDAYETDLPRIRKGQKVTLEVSSYPGELFEGKVSFIDPIIDPRTRTAQVRVEVSNQKKRLSPGMFAVAVIHAPEDAKPEAPLMIPRSAPLFTGERSVVYVKVPGQDRPTYEAREVRLGPQAGDVYPVVSGLKEGEEVVTEGAFALDSELQIRGGASMMASDDDLVREQRRAYQLSGSALAKLAPVVDAYLTLHKKLSSDELAGAKKAFSSLARRVTATELRASAEATEKWKQLQKLVKHAAKRGGEAKDLDQARGSFEDVSRSLIAVLRHFGNPLDSELRLAFCPMAFDGKGAEWLQTAEKVENPYFGSEMYRCGELRSTVKPKAHLAWPNPQPEPAAPVAEGHQH